MFRTYIEVMLTQLADGSGIGCEESLDMTPRLLTKKTNEEKCVAEGKPDNYGA